MSGILALDQATTVGWAFCEPGKDPIWGHERMGSRDTWEGAVYCNFRRFVSGLISRYVPDCLAFEAPFVPRPNRSGAAQTINPDVLRRGFGFVAQIVEMVESHEVFRCEEVQSAEFAKFFTGKGRFSGSTATERSRAKKAAVVAACKARGWQATHDEADALAILMFAEYKCFPSAALSRKMSLKQPTGPLFA